MKAHQYLQDMATFVEVARHQSFTLAAAKLNLPPSSVSRHIAQMEARLGIKLFHRTSRNVLLTATGKDYFAQSKDIIEAAQEAYAQVQGKIRHMQGPIKIGASVSVAQDYLAPFLHEFSQRYPEVRFEIEVSQHYANLALEGFDVVLRMSTQPLSDSSLVAYPLMHQSMSLFATPSYLAKFAPITEMAQLQDHLLTGNITPMVMAQAQRKWALTHKTLKPEHLHLINYHAWGSMALLREATLAGLGISCLPTLEMQKYVKADRLQEVLPDWFSKPVQLHALTTSRAQSQRVRCFIEELMAFFRAHTIESSQDN